MRNGVSDLAQIRTHFDLLLLRLMYGLCVLFFWCVGKKKEVDILFDYDSMKVVYSKNDPLKSL